MNSPETGAPHCPTCKSDRTQTIKLLCQAGTRSSSSKISGDFGTMQETSTTQLVASLRLGRSLLFWMTFNDL
jgi:hypothetical protein